MIMFCTSSVISAAWGQQLDRLASSKGYLSVSDFIVAVLWKVGFLSRALEKAKRDLPQNEAHAFGLSNMLMLLNGLLKYRHPDFSNAVLDDIERVTHDMAENTFMIPMKIQAIRTLRLTKTPQTGEVNQTSV